MHRAQEVRPISFGPRQAQLLPAASLPWEVIARPAEPADGAGAVRVVALRGGVGPERDGDAELFHRFAAVEPRGLGRDYHSTGQAGVHVLLSAFHSQRGGAVLADCLLTRYLVRLLLRLSWL